MKRLYLLFCVLSLSICKYSEEYLITPLLDKKYLYEFTFQFQIDKPISDYYDSLSNYYGDMPLPIIQLAAQSRVSYFKFATVQGRTQPYFFKNNTFKASNIFKSPQGTSIIYIHRNEHADFMNQQFIYLISGFTGIFIRGKILQISKEMFTAYDISIPCKENIETTLLKILPCKNQAGLLSLLFSKSRFIHSSHYKHLEIVFESSQVGMIITVKLILINQQQIKIGNTFKVCVEAKEASKSIFTQDYNLMQNNLHSDRYMTEYDYYHAITNKMKSQNIYIKLYEMIPHFVIPFFHTMEANITPIYLNYKEDQSTVFYLQYTLKPLEKLVISWKYETRLMQFESYSNDPQRGHDIEPSVILAKLDDTQPNQAEKTDNQQNDSYQVEFFFTKSLLVRVIEPDFSMPFNVMCLTSTALVFFFTSVFLPITSLEKAH